MPGEKARDAGLTLQEECRRGMAECIDRFQSELKARSEAMNEINDMFEAIHAKSLICGTEEELRESIPKLTNFYDELSEPDLLMEIPRLRRHLKAADVNEENAKEWSAWKFLTFIAEWDFIQSLPTLSLSLKLFLTICVSVASCERSFSTLKLIKTYKRSTMSQSRLSGLSILSIENEIARDIDFDEVINNFAAIKSRKKKL